MASLAGLLADKNFLIGLEGTGDPRGSVAGAATQLVDNYNLGITTYETQLGEMSARQALAALTTKSQLEGDYFVGTIGLPVGASTQYVEASLLSTVAEEILERIYGALTGGDIELELPGDPLGGQLLYGNNPNKATSIHTKRTFEGSIKRTQGEGAGKIVRAHCRAAFSDGVWVGHKRTVGWFKLQMRNGRLKWSGKGEDDFERALKLASLMK